MTRSSRKYLAAGGAGLAIATALLARRRRPDLRGQVVLITGGSRGLGLAMAREFAHQGCKVAICARNRDELEEARSLLREEGAEVLPVRCDVSDRHQVNEMVHQVRAYYRQIDILVNNAGEILVAPVENTTIEDFERAMTVMFWGVVYPTLAVLPEMRARRSGRIAAITSIGGKVSVPHLLAYSCAKFAAVAFSEGLRAELAPQGIQVTTIAPGLMRTGSHVNARFKGDHESEAAWFSTAATFPLVSMNAERAARKTVAAIRVGSSEKILSVPADLLARVHGAFPGLVPNLMAIVDRLLPEGREKMGGAKQGLDLLRNQGWFLRRMTTLGRWAGARLNQRIA